MQNTLTQKTEIEDDPFVGAILLVIQTGRSCPEFRIAIKPSEIWYLIKADWCPLIKFDLSIELSQCNLLK